MSQLVEAEIARKASILSILSARNEEKRKSLRSVPENEEQPNDPFLLVHISCFFLGFMNVMPLMFFGTAAGYWMYKFRDPNTTSDTTAGKDRTTLQSYFQPSSMAAQTLPLVLITTMWTVYGHKVPPMKRTIGCLTMHILIFLLFVLYTQIDTDTWQTGFFGMTLLFLMGNSLLLGTIQMSSILLLSKLAPHYMFYFLLGQNGTFITTCMQIVSTTVTDDSSTAGLIYFCCGTGTIFLTLILLLASRRTAVYKHFEVESMNEDNTEKIMTWSDAIELTKKIWPSQVIICLMFLTISSIHPSITTLVVSEYEEEETDWTKKYFIPVGIFLNFDFSALLGRIISRKAFLTPSNKWWFMGPAILRFLIFVPLFVYCNAQPRSIPVIFDKDWEFFVFFSLFGITMGFFMNVSFMSLKMLAENKQEGAFKLISLTSSVACAATTANGLIMVKLLNV